jgi:hypothetical protein
MPKKASMTPAPKQPKKTRMPKAETDQNWGKLTKSGTQGESTSPPKAQTKSKKKKTKDVVEAPKSTKKSKQHVLTPSNDESKFPHSGFPIRLEYVDVKDKKICWFQCEEHFIKHVTRYNLDPAQYQAYTNIM